MDNEPAGSGSVVCPSCGGEKRMFLHVRMSHGTGEWRWVECSRCGGFGVLDAAEAEWIVRGEVLREQRKRLGLSLREMASRWGVSVVLLSQAENGRIDPEEVLSAGRVAVAAQETNDRSSHRAVVSAEGS